MSKADAELNWWKNYYRENKNFKEIRKKDWFDRSKFLTGIENETEIGLDYGSGLLSMLEFSGLKFDAIDPLMDEYKKIMDLPNNYQVQTNRKYDWIWCINVLDHTEDPIGLVEDIKNKLKPKGRLYLEVNMDDNLGGCHYELYTKEKIDKLIPFKRDYENIIRNEPDKQSYYFARYIS